MRLSSVALLEGGDADGLAEGEEVTLKNWGNVKVTKIDKDADGALTRPCFLDARDSRFVGCCFVGENTSFSSLVVYVVNPYRTIPILGIRSTYL